MENICEVCIGKPEDLRPRKCICEDSDMPGTYFGMVLGLRLLAVGYENYLESRGLTEDFENWFNDKENRQNGVFSR